MKYFRKLEGDKVYLSPMSIEDAETYCRWLNDPLVAGNIAAAAKAYSLSAEREYIEKIQKENAHIYAIVLKETDAIIGNIGIEDIDNTSRTATLGLFIGDEESRGKGYGSEALRLACRYAFDRLNMHSLHLWVFSFNERAMNMYKKVGFKEAGRMRESYYLDGKYHDSVLMDILRDELK
ncbi:MAG: GNAT family N-acetyltransferase [Oscillospiraceae bacterium]|nr:GNAT family N-acetyltransferase [Oscillospiraceae bacterium]